MRCDFFPIRWQDEPIWCRGYQGLPPAGPAGRSHDYHKRERNGAGERRLKLPFRSTTFRKPLLITSFTHLTTIAGFSISSFCSRCNDDSVAVENLRIVRAAKWNRYSLKFFLQGNLWWERNGWHEKFLSFWRCFITEHSLRVRYWLTEYSNFIYYWQILRQLVLRLWLRPYTKNGVDTWTSKACLPVVRVVDIQHSRCIGSGHNPRNNNGSDSKTTQYHIILHQQLKIPGSRSVSLPSTSSVVVSVSQVPLCLYPWAQIYPDLS